MKHSSSVQLNCNNLDELGFQEVPFLYSSRLPLGLKEIFCMRFGRQKFNKSLISQPYLVWGRKTRGDCVRGMPLPPGLWGKSLVVHCPWSRLLHIWGSSGCISQGLLFLSPSQRKECIFLKCSQWDPVGVPKVHKSLGPSETEAPRNFSLLH